MCKMDPMHAVIENETAPRAGESGTSGAIWTALSTKLSLATSHGHNIMTQKMSAYQWSIGIRTHLYKKKIKIITSAGNLMMTIFWDCEDILHTEYLKNCQLQSLCDDFSETLWMIAACVSGQTSLAWQYSPTHELINSGCNGVSLD